MLPDAIKERLANWFADQVIYGQVATVYQGQPHIRTMMMQRINEAGYPVFCTVNTTQKWRDLELSPNIAVCIGNGTKGQIVVEGSVQLVAQKAAQQFWDALEDKLRKLYLPNPGDEVPETFGAIVVIPTRWEFLDMCFDDYQRSTRREFVWIDGSWCERALEPV